MFEEKTKVLIITGILSPMHDWRQANLMLRQTLEASGHFLVKICEEFRGMTKEALDSYDLILVNYDGMVTFSHDSSKNPPAIRFGEETEQALCDYVRDGGGIMFFHSAVLPKKSFGDAYLDLVGSWENEEKYKPYRETGYTIDVVPGHPITEGVEPHWALCDDDFFNWAEIASDAEVLATIHDPVNERETPVMWCRNYGKGRVFSCSLGHQQDTLRRLDFCRLLLRGCDWAAHGTITVAMPDRDADDNWMRSWPWYYSTPLGRDY